MAKRNKEAHYRELGDLITRWRMKSHSSALALYRGENKESSKHVHKVFSFSYSSYADFERGVALPSIDQMLEIAAHFSEPREAAALAWARVQMPLDLRRLFSPYPSQGVALPDSKEGPKIPEGKVVPQLSLENTWVLGPAEREIFLKHPWIIDPLLLMAVEFPDPVAIEDLGGKEVLEILKPCIDQKRIHVNADGLRLHDPFFHLPRNREWQVVRRQNIIHAAKRMMEDIDPQSIDSGAVFQEAVTRKLTAEEARALVTHLDRIKDTFFKTQPEGRRETYSFAAVLAPRPLKVKRG